MLLMFLNHINIKKTLIYYNIVLITGNNSWHFLSTCYVPDILLSVLHVSTVRYSSRRKEDDLNGDRLPLSRQGGATVGLMTRLSARRIREDS